jgi:hypothetical protein
LKAEDRIALTLGRLIIQTEAKNDEIAALKEELTKAAEAAPKKGK